MGFTDAINEAKQRLRHDTRMIAPAGWIFRNYRKMTEAERYEMEQEIRKAEKWRQQAIETDPTVSVG